MSSWTRAGCSAKCARAAISVSRSGSRTVRRHLIRFGVMIGAGAVVVGWSGPGALSGLPHDDESSRDSDQRSSVWKPHEATTCRVTDVQRQLLRGEDGAYLLVEPQAVFGLGRQLMIAGVPILETRVDSTGVHVRDRSDEYVGAIEIGRAHV